MINTDQFINILIWLATLVVSITYWLISPFWFTVLPICTTLYLIHSWHWEEPEKLEAKS